jgi:membrane-bound metal-dependent hydrolase YbcI (DUF457 family)
MHPYRAWPFLSDPHHPILSAIWAVLVHGTLSVLVLAPVLLAVRRRTLLSGVAFIAGVALDLDHAVVAQNLSPRAMEHLGHRPDTHSLLIALALTVATLALTRNRLAAWSVFAVIAAHLLFDAAGGNEYWLFPLKNPDSLPWLACPIGLGLLTFGSWRLAGRGDRGRSTVGRSLAARSGACRGLPIAHKRKV